MTIKKRVLALSVVAALGAGYFWNQQGSSELTWIFDTATADRGQIESLVGTAGTLVAVSAVTVGAEISGRIEEIYADYNSQVKQGDLLARIDDRSITAKVRQAEADLALSEAAVKQSKASLLEQKANYRLYQSETRRISELSAKGYATDSELEQAQSNEAMAEARITVAEAEITRAEAESIKRQAALEEVRLDLERTRIYSPVDGVVLERRIEEGQTVNANQSTPELFIIAEDMSRMQIEADIDEADIGQMHEGQQVRFTVDSYPGRVYRGEVEQVRLAATITSSVVTYTTIISVDNSDLSLYPGMTSNVDIIIGHEADALRVPNSALRFNVPKELVSGLKPQSVSLPAELFDSKDQQQQAEEFLTRLQNAAREKRKSVGGMPGPAGRPESGAGPARQKTRKQLAELVGEEKAVEIMRYQASRTKPGHRGGTEIWVLREGEPERLRLNMGLTDDRFSEVISGALKPGDEVIISARQEQG